MTHHNLLIGLVASFLIVGCSEDGDRTEAMEGDAVSALMPERFTSDALFEAGGGGCGMTLWEPGENPFEVGFVFFHGLDEADAFVMLNGEMHRLALTASSGEAFFGQWTDQTFRSDDGAIIVRVTATPGAQGETESIAVEEGTLTVNVGGRVADLTVVGDAGC